MTSQSLFEPMMIPTQRPVLDVEVGELRLHLRVSGASCLPLAHTPTLSTARAAMSRRICLPSNWIFSAAS